MKERRMRGGGGVEGDEGEKEMKIKEKMKEGEKGNRGEGGLKKGRKAGVK